MREGEDELQRLRNRWKKDIGCVALLYDGGSDQVSNSTLLVHTSRPSKFSCHLPGKVESSGCTPSSEHNRGGPIVTLWQQTAHAKLSPRSSTPPKVVPPFAGLIGRVGHVVRGFPSVPAVLDCSLRVWAMPLTRTATLEGVGKRGALCGPKEHFPEFYFLRTRK